MKKNKILLCSCLLFSLFSCQSQETTSSSQTSQVEDSIVELQTNPVNKISSTGVLIDIAVNRWLCVGVEYTGTFSFSSQTDQTARIENSNPENIEISLKESSGINALTFKAKKAGDTILQIYDSDGVLKYRNVIKARNKIAEDKLTDFLINVDHFQAVGLNGESSLTFLSSKSAVFSGFDGDQDLGNINFTYKFSGNSSNSDDEYEFTITEFPNDINDLQCVKFYLDFTGCMLHLMTANITVDIYLPVYSA